MRYDIEATMKAIRDAGKDDEYDYKMSDEALKRIVNTLQWKVDNGLSSSPEAFAIDYLKFPVAMIDKAVLAVAKGFLEFVGWRTINLQKTLYQPDPHWPHWLRE